MSNRFEKLYSLPSPLYAPSMPVIIVAGALLKDTQTNKVLAQLKFKSISPKEIKAVTVSLLPLDTANQPLGEKETHQILDLAASRDAEFGQKSPLYFSNNTTRAYRVIVEEVIFSDNTVWKSTGTPLSGLSAQKTAQDQLSDAELVKQYKLEYGERAAYIADTYFDLWRCNCGAINHSDEHICHICKVPQNKALSFDTDQLKSSCNARIEQESQEKALVAKAARKAKKRDFTFLVIIAIIFLSVIGANFVMNNQTAKKYQDSLNGTVFDIRVQSTYNDGLVEAQGGHYAFFTQKCTEQSSHVIRRKMEVISKESVNETYSYHVRGRNFGKEVYVALGRDKDNVLSVTKVENGEIVEMSIGDMKLVKRRT